jgi:hypothetical protein
MCTSRLPLAGLFLWVGVVFLGLMEGSHSVADAQGLEARTMVLVAVYVLLLYGVAIIHSVSVQEIRPWLYEWEEERGRLSFYFRTDSPALFTELMLLGVAVLISVVFYVSLAPAAGLGSPWGKEGLTIFQSLLVACSVVIRDCLIIQWFRRRQQTQRDWLLLLLYFCCFFVIPHLVNLYLEQYRVDLTPFGMLGHYFSPSGFAWQAVVLLNALLIVFLGILNWRWITHSYRNLPAQLKKQSERAGM